MSILKDNFIHRIGTNAERVSTKAPELEISQIFSCLVISLSTYALQWKFLALNSLQSANLYVLIQLTNFTV